MRAGCAIDKTTFSSGSGTLATQITNKISYLPPVQLSDRIHLPHIVDGGGVVGLQNGRLDLHDEVHTPCPGDNACGVHDHFLDTP